MRPVPTALVVAGLLLVAGNLRAAITTVGPVLPGIEAALGLSSVAASVLVSLPLLAFAAVSPIAPRLAHRIGLERAIGLGLAVLAVGLVVRSTPPLALLWVGTALIGIAIAVLNVVLPALVKRDFPRRIGQITGAYSAVQSAFAAIAAGVAVPVAGATSLGWRLPLGMWAGLALIALGVLLPQLRRGPVRPGGSRAPRAEAAGGTGPVAQAVRSPWGSALGWQVTAFMGLQSVLFYVFITWLPAIEASAGIDEAVAGAHQFLYNACAIAGSLACSTAIGRLRDQRALGVLVPTVYLIATLGVLLAPGASAVWASIGGVAGGASIVLALSFLGLRSAHHAQAASLSGMAQSIGYLFAAAGPVAFGAIHDATGSWTPALLLLLAVEAVLIGFGYLSGRDRTIG
ncbi:MFS transporter [Gulosibacter sp. 10]|uniref:MFS transporter n=1 Tax=Gulosibacter sp. 10 TaxID=1255570 RepID=UPI0020CD3745|nr:MFS transporter [Gulosibacter sp. 10]